MGTSGSSATDEAISYQARAGQYQDALATAVSAEQLSNNANIEFGLREQTPAQLISLIKMKSAETASIAKTTQPQVPSGCANLNLQPAPATNVAARPAIDTESPLPQWPGRDSVTQPQQVAENLAPAVTTPRASTPSIDKQFKTAEFLNPRPSQVKSPGTTSGTPRLEFNEPRTSFSGWLHGSDSLT